MKKKAHVLISCKCLLLLAVKFQSFLVPKSEIAENEYDLSINRYKEVVYESVEYDPPKVILKRLADLDDEIAKGRKELEGMLG